MHIHLMSRSSEREAKGQCFKLLILVEREGLDPRPRHHESARSRGLIPFDQIEATASNLRKITLLHRGDSPGPADGSHLPARCSSAEELIAAIGLEPRHAHSGRHFEPLQDLSRSRIDSPHIALVTFPGAVPELSVDPGDPGDEAVGLDRAKNRSCLGIDLMDLPVPILPHPERPLGPREPRVTTAARRRDRGEHTAGLRSKPDVLTVIRDSMHVVGTGKGSIFTY